MGATLPRGQIVDEDRARPKGERVHFLGRAPASWQLGEDLVDRSLRRLAARDHRAKLINRIGVSRAQA